MRRRGGGRDPASWPPTALRAVAERIEAHKEALARANAAVVGVEVTAIESARSIATLGRERQGSGVLIGDDGLVLTIGYLILEADHVDLVPAAAGASRRGSSPTTWHRDSAWSRRWRRSA